MIVLTFPWQAYKRFGHCFWTGLSLWMLQRLSKMKVAHVTLSSLNIKYFSKNLPVLEKIWMTPYETTACYKRVYNLWSLTSQNIMHLKSLWANVCEFCKRFYKWISKRNVFIFLNCIYYDKPPTASIFELHAVSPNPPLPFLLRRPARPQEHPG